MLSHQYHLTAHLPTVNVTVSNLIKAGVTFLKNLFIEVQFKVVYLKIFGILNFYFITDHSKYIFVKTNINYIINTFTLLLLPERDCFGICKVGKCFKNTNQFLVAHFSFANLLQTLNICDPIFTLKPIKIQQLFYYFGP